jgi:hypothetical protein
VFDVCVNETVDEPWLTGVTVNALVSLHEVNVTDDGLSQPGFIDGLVDADVEHH